MHFKLRMASLSVLLLPLSAAIVTPGAAQDDPGSADARKVDWKWVTRLLVQGDPPDRVRSLVGERCYNFYLTPEAETSLRNLVSSDPYRREDMDTLIADMKARSCATRSGTPFQPLHQSLGTF